MNILDLKSQLNLLFKYRTAPLIWGKHGIGKTSIVSQFCQEQGYYYVMQALGTKESGDIQGLLDTKDGTSAFLPPVFVKEVNTWAKANPDKYAVIHLDEINHIHKDMQAVLFSALLGNQIGDLKMADNVRYVASANPPTKDYPGVFDFKNMALVDRFCHIDLNPSVQEWAKFAKKAGIADVWVDFFLASPQFLDPVGEPYDVFKKIKGSRRSAIMAAQLAEDGASMELLEGAIGSAAVASFQAYSKKRDEDMLQKDDIVGRKALTKKTRETLAQWTKDEQYGKMEALIEQIKAYFGAMEPDTATQQDADRVQDLWELLPVDIAYASALDLMENYKSVNMKFDQSVNKRCFAYWQQVITDGKVVFNVK